MYWSQTHIHTENERKNNESLLDTKMQRVHIVGCVYSHALKIDLKSTYTRPYTLIYFDRIVTWMMDQISKLYGRLTTN